MAGRADMKGMRILLTNYFGFEAGGVEKSTYVTAKLLEKMGHKVFIASTGNFPGAETRKFGKFPLPLPMFQKGGLKDFLSGVIRREKIDVIHAQDRLTSFAAVLAAEKTGIPSVVHFRDYWFFCTKSAALKPNLTNCGKCGLMDLATCAPLHRLPWEFLKMRAIKNNWRILRRADLKLCSSGAVRERLKIAGINDAKVVPNPVETGKFVDAGKLRAKTRKELGVDGFVVAYVGRFTYEKGIMNLLSAMPELLERVPESRLLLVGDGTQMQEAREFVRNHKLGKNVVFAGMLPYEKIPAAMAAADAVAVPSVLEEPFGRVVVEGMASGKAVLASNVGGMKYIIEDGTDGFLLDPLNPKEWAKRLSEVAENRALRAKIGRKAQRKALGQYSGKAIAEKLVSCYRSVL